MLEGDALTGDLDASVFDFATDGMGEKLGSAPSSLSWSGDSRSVARQTEL